MDVIVDLIVDVGVTASVVDREVVSCPWGSVRRPGEGWVAAKQKKQNSHKRGRRTQPLSSMNQQQLSLIPPHPAFHLALQAPL